VVVFLIATAGAVVAFFASQAVLHSKHISIAFSDADVTRAVTGGAMLLTVLALFGFALGAILRNTAGGISALVSVIFVIPTLIDILGSSWKNTPSPYLPTSAGEAIMTIHRQPHTLAPWTGSGVFVAYTAALLVLAAIRLRRRDV
jgi:ABC-2 type transport system permease protein